MCEVDPSEVLTREEDLLPFETRRRLLVAVAVKHSRDIPGDPAQQLLRPESRPRGRLKLERGRARTGLETCAAAGLKPRLDEQQFRQQPVGPHHPTGPPCCQVWLKCYQMLACVETCLRVWPDRRCVT